MKYLEIALGNNQKAMICFQDIVAVEISGSCINIEYPRKTINLTFSSMRSTRDSDALRDQAYDKIKKILEKL